MPAGVGEIGGQRPPPSSQTPGFLEMLRKLVFVPTGAKHQGRHSQEVESFTSPFGNSRRSVDP